MNKSVRFLVVFIIVVALVVLSWGKDTRGVVVGDSVVFFTTSPTATPSPVVVQADNTVVMRNLVLVEFFAGY